MKERPILFSAPMVRALLDGSKTQTRRIVKDTGFYAIEGHHGTETAERERSALATRCRFGMPGDRLWVREAWRTVAEADCMPPRDLNAAHRLWMEADAPHQPGFGKLRPSMFMPRWASRINLEITGVRVERLNDISEHDALNEGVTFLNPVKPGRANRMAREAFADLWQSINGAGAWDANPWVWVVEFRRLP